MTENVNPERKPIVTVELHGTPVPGLGACLECIGNYKIHVENVENVANEVPAPGINFAITLAPSWQQQQIMGQMIVTCVAIPACLMHLGVAELTPAQKAMQSGLVLPRG